MAAARRLARSSNEVAAEAIRGHPGRFGGFACLPRPDVDGALAEIDYGLGTLGLDGVVLLTSANGAYLGDSRLDPFDELNRRRAVVFLHPTVPAGAKSTSLGYAPSLIEFVFDTTRALTHLVLSGTLAIPPAGADALSWDITGEVGMTDMLIRDVPDEVIAALDAHAGRLGLSRSEYVRRRLAQDAQLSGSPVSISDLSRFAEDFSDLADPAVMARAWQ